MDATAVRERAGELSREPGVYRFLAADGRTLYVGKAVDLRDRVRSYADPRGERIARMVAHSDAIDVAVTDTETQALLLEANLIKRHSPRYNVRLKDDKSYPLVQLTDHERPRIEITRDPDPGATVFGPYTDKGRVEVVVKALRETYGVRGCSDHKYAGRSRPCLDHDIGLCSAPCTGEIDGDDYLGDVASVARFLGGETGVLADPLRREMERMADEESFERAANLRDRLRAVEAFHEGGGEAVTARTEEGRTDILGAVVAGETATVARLAAEGGKLIERERHTLDTPERGESREEEENEDGVGASVVGVLAAFLAQYYAERTLPDALLLPERPDDTELLAWLDSEGVDVRVPGAGREATLVDLALKNARRGRDRDDGTAALAEALGVGSANRIEGFDVSHTGGRAAVGSDVTFLEGKPEKAGYRRKKLAERNDDYANMKRLIRWRAERAVENRDDRPDPDLLLIDGGRGQLEAAREALSEVGWNVPTVALAKADERVLTGDDEHDWPADAPELHLLQRVRDEAHRFAVQYHQTVRDSVATVLDDVPGIGSTTRRRLLRRFGSVDGVRAASPDELRSVDGVGQSTAETIHARL